MLLSNSHAQSADNQAATQLRVLVLCTGNSARSIMAEAILNTLGAELFQAYSAGSRPAGKVNPMALAQLSQLALPENLVVRSKSWKEFTAPNAPELDLLLSVCDNAAAEVCPVFPGRYEHIHWGLPDPAGASDNPEEATAAFARCFQELKTRVETLASQLSATDTRETIFNAMRAFS